MNQKEFLAHVTPVQDRLYRLAKRLLVSEDEAQDATQEVLIKLWSYRKKFKKLKSVEAFAVTITKNHCYDKLKLKSSSNLQLVHTNYEDEHYNTVKQTENQDSVNWVLKLMNDLPTQLVGKVANAVQQLEHLQEWKKLQTSCNSWNI